MQVFFNISLHRYNLLIIELFGNLKNACYTKKLISVKLNI